MTWRALSLIPALALAGAALAPGATAAAARPAAAVSLDWPQYEHGTQRSSVSNATAFTTSNSASVTQVWHWQPPVISGEPTPALDASPTVVAGVVYIGALSGGFYALNESTGAVMWKTEIGPADPSQPDGHYNWSSPTVVGGHIYAGLSSSCDDPLTRGGVVELDQHTGQVLHTWYTVPKGSIAAASGRASRSPRPTATSGCPPGTNAIPPSTRAHPVTRSGIRSPSSTCPRRWACSRRGGRPAPPGMTGTSGSSPTLFGARSIQPDVGACNKNGNYYALKDNPLGSSPLWTDKLGTPAGPEGSCLSSAIWDGTAGTLYLSGDGTTIGGKSYGGSVGQVNPSTGAFLWHTGLPCAVMGTPTLDSAGVLAVGTYHCVKPATPAAYLVNASTGAILSTLPIAASKVFAQPVFAQGTLFVATESGGLYDLAPGAARY